MLEDFVCNGCNASRSCLRPVWHENVHAFFLFFYKNINSVTGMDPILESEEVLIT